MDKTETYREMRLAAIPELGLGAEPDKFYQASLEPSNDLWMDAEGNIYFHKDPYCQLERQDQLQAMVIRGDKQVDLFALRQRFCEFGTDIDGITEYGNSFTSHEQLWLAFVMQELHGKVWSGTEWKGDSDGREKEDREAKGKALSGTTKAPGNGI